MYDLQILPTNLTPDLKALIGNGTCVVLSDGMGLFPQMNSGGHCRVYAAISAYAKILNDEPWPEAGGRKRWLLNVYAGWDEKFQELITASEEETATPRRIFGFDPAFKWEVPSEITGVTIIGEYLSYVHLHSDVCHRNMNLLFTQYRRCSTCYGSCRRRGQSCPS